MTATNKLEGKLYAVDTDAEQIAVYVKNSDGTWQPEWQTAPLNIILDTKSDMREFVLYRECGLIYYDVAAQMLTAWEAVT